jgi:hypothetical protein
MRITVLDFQAKAEAWKQATTNLNTSATTYVTSLAYQQIYYAQNSNSTIVTALSSILGQTIPSTMPPSEEIPVFPWLSSSQLAALSTDNAQLNTVTQNLLTAFRNYRNIEYVISYDMAAMTQATVSVNQAYYNFFLAGYGVPGYDVGICYQVYIDAVDNQTACQTTLSADQNRESGFINALTSSITAYEAMYKSIKNLGTPLPEIDTTVQTIISFCENWNTNVIQPAQAIVSTAIADAMTKLVSANQALISTFNSQFSAAHPGLSPTSITGLLNQLAAVQTALTVAGVTIVPSITTPQLPASYSSMSMVELMKIIGQAELMSEELIRQSADSEHQINSLRLQFAITHLMLYANEISALETWSNLLIEAQKEFNTGIEADNATMYNNTLAVYTIYQNHIPEINAVITQINNQIVAENARGQALVTAANSINSAVLQAIASEQISVPEAPNYLINNYVGVTTTMPTVPPSLTFIPIPLFDLVTTADLPNPPYSSYPGVETLNTSLLSSFNQSIEALLNKIAAFPELVQQALQTATTPTTKVDLSQILLKSTMPVEDLMTKVAIFKTSFSLLYSFLTQTALSGISRENQATLTQDLLAQLYEILGIAGGTAGIGASIGLGSSLLASAGAFGAALSQVVNSTIFNTAIETIVQRAAIFAGLSVAGTLPEILKQLTDKNITLSDLLEMEGEKSGEDVEAQTRTDLINALIQQLALAASTPGVLQQNAVDILQNFPSLATLSQEELTQLISGLVTMQQMILLAITVMLGVTLGITPGQIASDIFSSADASAADMISRFQGLGIPETKARELAAIVAGRDDLETVLIGLGFDTGTRTVLMAIIAASEGKISLTDGAPGGPAFLDTLLSALKDRGITITVDINSPDFIKELVLQLEIKATEEQKAILKKQLLEEDSLATTPNTLSLSQQFQQAAKETWNQINAIYGAPTPLPTFTFSSIPPLTPQDTLVIPPAIPSPIPPSSILSHFVEQFQALAPDIKSELLAEVARNPALASISGVSDEQKAALMLALRLGVVTVPEATSLLNLSVLESQMAAKGQAFTVSNIETEIITRLFTPTPEELQQLEEARRRDVNAPYEAPATLSPLVLDQVSIAFRRYFNDLADESKAAKAYEAFAETIQRLSDFNKVALDFLLDPAMIIMRQFSIITRTAQDRIQQPKITLTG